MSINYDKIQEINSQLTSTPVKGKKYIDVAQRIKGFRMLFPEGTIETEIVMLEQGMCVMKAIARNEEGRVLATGTAYEMEGSSFINGTSYIENCETSAVGRALGMLGIGSDSSVSSAEEVQNAILQQDMKKSASKPKIATIQAVCKKHKVDAEQWLVSLDRTWETLTEEEATKMLLGLKKKYGDD